MTGASKPTASIVVIVEDEPVVALGCSRQLEDHGYRVSSVVARASEVIARVREQRPDVVLMDIKLPGDVDGITLAEELFVCDDTPVVFLSAFSDPEVIRRATQAGAYGYLTKPVTTAALVATLEMAIQKHQDLRRCRDASAWLVASLEQVDAAWVGLDADGSIRYMNRKSTELLGVMLMEVKGTRPPWALALAALPVDVSHARQLVVLRARTEIAVEVTKLALPGGGSLVLFYGSLSPRSGEPD